MSYRVRFTTHTGATGYWDGTFATHTGASMSAMSRADVTGYTYTVEEVPDAPEPKPEPGSMAAHHFEILRTRVNVLEALVEARGKAVADAHVANLAMHRDLALAIQLGDALRQAMRTGAWRAGDDAGMANNAIAGWDRWKPSLGKAHSVPVGASDAPVEGGDSDRRRLEALRAFLEGKQSASIAWWEGEFSAVHVSDGVEITAPTLAALADKLAVKEAKP